MHLIYDHADLSNTVTVTDSKFDPCVTLNHSMPIVPGRPLLYILYATAALIAVTVGFWQVLSLAASLR